jgi:hypothetical protein
MLGSILKSQETLTMEDLQEIIHGNLAWTDIDHRLTVYIVCEGMLSYFR